MKKRNGFVSNSSSSSFVIVTKVYCSNCKFFHSIDMGLGHADIEQCHSESNLIIKTKHTYLKPITIVEYIAEPKDLNKNNNCQWYESKERD